MTVHRYGELSTGTCGILTFQRICRYHPLDCRQAIHPHVRDFLEDHQRCCSGCRLCDFAAYHLVVR